MSKSQHLAGAISPSIDSLFAFSHAICPLSARVKCSQGHWSLQKKELPKWFNLMTSSKKKRPRQAVRMQSCVQNCSETTLHAEFWTKYGERIRMIRSKNEYNPSTVVVFGISKVQYIFQVQQLLGMSEAGAQEEILKVDPAPPLWEIFLTKSQPRKCPTKCTL